MTHPRESILSPEIARRALTRALATTKTRRYLGDAVYASWDGYQIELNTGDGNDQTIYLDDRVQSGLMELMREISHCHKLHTIWIEAHEAMQAAAPEDAP